MSVGVRMRDVSALSPRIRVPRIVVHSTAFVFWGFRVNNHGCSYTLFKPRRGSPRARWVHFLYDPPCIRGDVLLTLSSTGAGDKASPRPLGRVHPDRGFKGQGPPKNSAKTEEFRFLQNSDQGNDLANDGRRLVCVEFLLTVCGKWCLCCADALVWCRSPVRV